MCPELQHSHLCLPVTVKLWFVSFPWMDCKSFSALMQLLFQHLFPKWNNTYHFHWLLAGWDTAAPIFNDTSKLHHKGQSHGDAPPTTQNHGVGPLSKANPCHREQEILPTYAKCTQHRRREVREFRNAKPACLAHPCILSEIPCPWAHYQERLHNPNVTL